MTMESKRCAPAEARKATPSARVVLAFLFAACGGDDVSNGTTEDAGLADASMLEVPKDAAADAASSASSDCPSDLECLSASGVFLCQKPGPELVTCTTAADCSFGMCFPYSGLGICLSACTPNAGLPSTTAISGVAVQFQAGKGFLSTGAAPLEPVLSDVEVCVISPKLNVPCVKTGADGRFKLTGIPPNRTLFPPSPAVLSLKKDGFVATSVGVNLGNTDQSLNGQVRMFTTADAQAVASALGATVPDETTSWWLINPVALNSAAAGSFDVGPAADVSVVSAPATGKGPFYLDAQEQPPTQPLPVQTSAAGAALFTDVVAGSYKVNYNHATLDCGTKTTPSTVTGLPGYIQEFGGALCGPGVH